jgi:diaminopimelate epimerase
MQLKFTKMQGLGNDFVVINNIDHLLTLSVEHIRFLADRHFGVGFDQLLLIESPQQADVDFHYRIFNADGSEAGQCGNGVRCVARYLLEKGLTQKKHLSLSAKAGIMLVDVYNFDHITVNMGLPIFDPTLIPFKATQQQNEYTLSLFESDQKMMVVSMGNPHAIVLVDNIESAPVETLGKRIARHKDFPEGVNVSFMEIKEKNRVALRVLERGTGETLACGSGACAAAVVGIMNNKLDNTVLVELPGGSLSIQWFGEGSPVLMTGAAASVFEGSMVMDDQL